MRCLQIHGLHGIHDFGIIVKNPLTAHYSFAILCSLNHRFAGTITKMKVRIGTIEISDVTIDELDELVKRYGNSAFEPTAEAKQKTKTQPNGTSIASGAQDHVLLKKLVDAASVGITTIEIGDILGRRGKAARPALKEWGRRIGLSTDENIEVFEEARVGTQRGLRIKSSLLDVAKHILNQR